MSFPEFCFLVLATAAIAGCIITLWSRYIVHSAFGLMLTLIAVAGFYVLLGSDFLAVTQIIVYVGGVVVLYLFGVMLTPPDLGERSVPRILVVGGFSVGALVVLVNAAYGIKASALSGYDAAAGGTARGTLIRDVGRKFMIKDDYLLAFELASVLLLIALIGAVYIARRRGEAAR
jgi:NADH-quinone oxidoreductase subunit J